VVLRSDVASILEEIANLLEVQDANPFRVRAYRRAARSIFETRAPLEETDLESLPGIGADLAQKIQEILRTGTCSFLQELRSKVPEGLVELLSVQGLGPKRVRALHEAGVEDVRGLVTAARANALRALPRFGAKLETRILDAALRHGAETRHPLSEGDAVARELKTLLEGLDGVEAVAVAGSLRRRKPTIGDVDLVVASRRGAQVRKALRDLAAEVVASGKTKTTLRMASGLQVDVRVVAPAAFGAALLYFTGSKSHNVALRRLALARGLKLNEYGLHKGRKVVARESEKEVYQALDLAYVEPELREDTGEVDAAADGALPRLVHRRDVRGDLHCHTSVSDARSTLADMAKAARARGLEYVAVTDHSAQRPGGLDAKRLAAHVRRIERFNERIEGFRFLKGVEVDILADGRLGIPASALKDLDVVVCGLHTKFRLDRAKQTQRVLRAMSGDHAHILAHPSARRIRARPPVDLAWDDLLDSARNGGWHLEANGQPLRLDLEGDLLRKCKDAVKVSLGSDAHAPAELAFLDSCVEQARRGWLQKGDVLNTLPWTKLESVLAR
jgi:DNA polymerase (family X)